MASWKQKYESLGLDASGIDGIVVCVLPTCSDFTCESLIIMVSFFYRGYYCCWFFHPEGKWAASVSIKYGEFKKTFLFSLGEDWWARNRGGWERGTPLLVVSLSSLTACQTHTTWIVLLGMLHWTFWKNLTVLAGLSVAKMGLKPGAACDRFCNCFSCFLFRVIDSSMKNFKAFFRWLYVGKIGHIVIIQYLFDIVTIEMQACN